MDGSRRRDNGTGDARSVRAPPGSRGRGKRTRGTAGQELDELLAACLVALQKAPDTIAQPAVGRSAELRRGNRRHVRLQPAPPLAGLVALALWNLERDGTDSAIVCSMGDGGEAAAIRVGRARGPVAGGIERGLMEARA